jgi:hypothetical protein
LDRNASSLGCRRHRSDQEPACQGADNVLRRRRAPRRPTPLSSNHPDAGSGTGAAAP